MGNKESKKKSDTITPENDAQETAQKSTKQKRSKKEKKPTEPKSPKIEPQVMMPVDPNAVFVNKEFLNDLSVFIVKAYDTKFNGSFNEYLVNFKIHNLKVTFSLIMIIQGILPC